MTIGLFAPLPLAIMIPFMAAQSAAMALAFGTNFQYGKRKISSMSNEEFNALTPEILTKNLTADISKMIPHVQQSMNEMTTLQGFIIRELIEEIKKLPENIIGGLTGTEDQDTKSLGLPPGIPSFLTPIIPTVIPTDPLVSGKGLPTPQPQARQYNAVEQYASQWLDISRKVANWRNITIQQLLYLMTQRVKGNLFPEWSSLGNIMITHQKKIQRSKIKTSAQVTSKIKETSTGLVQQIALLYRTVIENLNKIFNQSASLRNSNISKFKSTVSQFNRLVQSNRMPQLAINAEASIKRQKITRKS